MVSRTSSVISDVFQKIGTEFRVNTYDDDDQISANLATLSDGRYVVVWRSTMRDGSFFDIFGQIFNADGSPSGSELPINEYTDGVQDQAAVTALADGGFIVVWMSNGQDGSGNGIIAQAFGADGSRSGPEFVVPTHTDGNQIRPQIAVRDDGSYVVVWVSYDNDGAGTGYDVYGRNFNSDGTPAGDDFQVNTYTPNSQTRPDLTMLSDGSFVVAWQSTSQDTDDVVALRARLYGSDGNPVGDEITVNEHNLSSRTGVRVTALDDGGFMMVWEAYGEDGSNSGVFGRQFDSDGLPVGNQFLVNSYTTGNQSYQEVTARPGGGFLVVWASYQQSDGSGYDVYGQLFDANGDKDGGEFLVNTTTLSHRNTPSATFLSEDSFVVSWDHTVGGDSRTDVYSQIFSINNVSTGDLSISGTAEQGQTLSLSQDLDDPDGIVGSISYQWQRDGVAIGGATGESYTLTQDDVGAAITVVASFTDGIGTVETITSDATSAVANVNETPTGSVTISGTLAEDAVLTAAHTLADQDGLGTISYQWLRDGVNITGATGASYTLTQADVGASISVVASYVDGFGTAERVTSAATPVVANVNDAPTGSVTISGALAEDAVLTAAHTLGDEDGLGTISYQWLRDGVNITGATGASYTLTQADVGAAISVVASYTDGFGAQESVTSAATEAVVRVNEAPSGADRTVTLDEDGSYSFSAADFGFSDSDGDSLAALILTALPTSGSLTLDGAAVSLGEEIAAARLSGLTWTPAAGAFGVALAALEFRLRDSGGTAHGGQDLSARYAMTFDVIEVSDPVEPEPEPDPEAKTVTGTDGDDVLTADPSGSALYTMEGSDTVYAGVGEDTIHLEGEDNLIIGRLEDLDGDGVLGFARGDSFEILDMSDGQVQFDPDSGRLTLTGAETQAEIDVQGAFEGSGFLAFTRSDGVTVVALEDVLPELSDGQRLDPSQINGIANQAFLTGRGATFELTLQDMGYASYNSSLGVYEVDGDGTIVNVRILFGNANADKSASVELGDIDTGHELGFFLVRDGAGAIGALDPDAPFSFVNGAGDAGRIADGTDLLLASGGTALAGLNILHSYDGAMNGDGLEHVVSGVAKDGLSMFIGFEDQMGGGDYDYEDVVFRIHTEDALDFV